MHMTQISTTKHHIYDIVIIGGGSSGICAAIKLKQAGFDNFIVLEQGGELGGTWYWNQYPGAECDVQSHLYSFSFESNPNWSRPYAGQPEILDYLKHCAKKYEILEHIKFDTEVTKSSWSDKECHWTLSTKHKQVYRSRIFVSAIGMMNKIVWPDIEARESFKGSFFHSARWDHKIDVRNRNVGVIGLAASAIQFIPEIASTAKQLKLFQRTANWVVPKPNEPYSSEELRKFRKDESTLAESRAEIYDQWNTLCTFNDKEVLHGLEKDGLTRLEEVKDIETRKKLTPNYPFGCKRPLFSDHYYPVFNRDNVELITEPILSISPKGVVISSKEVELDILIYATGFETTSFLNTIQVIGRKGMALEKAWEDGAQAYLGVSAHGFPNMFMLYGPNTNQGSLLFMIEKQVEYLVKQIKRMKDEEFDWIELRKETMEEFNVELQKDLAAVEVFQADCGNDFYYRSGPSGRMVTQWPYSMDAYRDALETSNSDIYNTG